MNPGGRYDSPGRQRLRRLVGALFIGAIILFGLQIRLPFFILAPGITRPAHELVHIEGGGPPAEAGAAVEADPGGGFLITTLAARQATVGKIVLAALDPASRIVPRSSFLPPGMSMDEYVAENRELMRQSQLKAMAAAFDYLDLPSTLEGEGFFVRAVLPRSAAEGKLLPGDVITAVRGAPVALEEDLSRAMAGLSRGDTVTMKIERDGEEQDITVKLAASPPAAQPWAALGIIGSTANLQGDFPEDISIQIEADNIAGPSAGLAFGLEILNRLLEEDLTGGRLVAVTGTLAHDGEIGPVGGVAFKARAAKAAGAALFIVPEGNGDEARRARQVDVIAASRLDGLVDMLLEAGNGGEGEEPEPGASAAAPLPFDTPFNP